ncbi:hypothetical protein DFH06DRAFT_1321668 [Mycena polygramma]|nr:hypothetical protein DFH06DRAFT_1321668 [Mycena polygramma]
MDVTPGDLPLPAFLDPILVYLSETLPAPVYTFIITLLSHLLALCTAFYALFLSLLSTHPLQWDAQTVLPPLIALLTSYLAIVSLYRTTSWMFRTSLWFIKWGTVIGAIVAASSWLLFQQDVNGLAGRGIVAGVGSLVLDMLNGDERNAAGGPRTRSRSRKQAKKSNARLKKPKPWDSFESHREWQYQENEGANGGAAGDVLGNIMNAAGEAVAGSRWWEAAKSAFMGEEVPDEQESSPGQRKAKTKTR